MTQEAAVPASLIAQIKRWIDDGVAAGLRSAPNRNSSISSGGSFTIQGGRLVLVSDDGVNILYSGPVQPDAYDGSDQQGFILRRADGTAALAMFDAAPGVGGLVQALNWYDRGGNIVLADDTSSAQGVARPYLDAGTARLVRYADWPTFGLAAINTWETIYSWDHVKQSPRLEVCVFASMDTAATTGNLRIMVNGVQLGSTAALTFGQGPNYFGPLAVAGSHMQVLDVQVQVQRTTATGGVKLAPSYCRGRQS